ncbi:MAG TPA: DMT family transporter [Thermoanaerobaculia bacterium]|jgi:drug/metabolite transporter (DMT)-like permease|nr:DMT family transporter [Thermoanaerobaculia bacterium]
MTLPVAALALVVASSLGWSGFDLLRKLLVRQVAPVALLLLLTLGSVPLFAAWVWIDGVAAPGPGYLAPALASVLLNVVANLLFLHGMRLAPISVAIPLLSLTPVFTTLTAIPLLGERPSAAGVAGILLVIAGAIWLNWPRRPADRRGEAPAAGDPRRSLAGAMMVATTALLWSLTPPLDKMAVERAGAPLHGMVLTGGVALAVFGVLAFQGGLGELGGVRRIPGLLVLALVVSSAALGLQFLAMPKVFVGTIETLKRGIGNCMSLIYGRLFFHEAVTASKILAVGLMAVGVGMILGF